MPEIAYDYGTVPTIREFARSDARIRGLMGPFGSGKSSGCVIEVLRRAMAQEPDKDGIRRSRWGVIRNTYQQLRDTTIRTFHDWLPPAHFGDWYVSDHRFVINRVPGVHTEVMFRALDRPDQLGNLLSLELTGAWVNEAREVPWTIIKALMGRIDRFPAVKDGGCTWAGIWLDSNPPDVDSWWYRIFEDERPEGVLIFKQPSGLADNAENRPNLAKNYYEELAKLYAGDPDALAVYIHGSYGYIQDGKPVYPEYNDTLHCQPCTPLPGVVIARGWDYGLTPSCVFTQLSTSGQWLILDELVSDNMAIDEFGDQVIGHSARHYHGYKFEDYGDPAGHQRSQTDAKTCAQILRGKNIDVQPGDQDLSMRLESVKRPLRLLRAGKPVLQIDPKCKMLRRGFGGRYRYRRMQTSQERYSDVPEKNDYSHPHDALQYVATRLFGAKLKGINRNRGATPQPKIGVI